MIGRGELKKLFHYNPKSGLFTRLVSKNSKHRIGDVAGSLHKQSGYIKIEINKKSYMAHRLAWLYMTGVMPVEVDHDNQIKDDNRWINLNGGNHQDNMKNASKRHDNTSGQTGVMWLKRRNRWCARITVDKKVKDLGSFVDYSDAVNARKNAEVLYGFHKNHGT